MNGVMQTRRNESGVVTFALACVMCCAICVALTIAIVAGVAYGYNYSLAEFITSTRHDVTVYLRRGQFYEKTGMVLNRRSGAGEEDFFNANGTTDNEETETALSKPLADTWLKSQDTRNYAEKLTKFTPNIFDRAPEPFSFQSKEEVPASPVNLISHPFIPILPRHNESSETRKSFRPLHDFGSVEVQTRIQEYIFPTSETSLKSLGFGANYLKQMTASSSTKQEGEVPKYLWTRTMSPFIPEDVSEEIDEEKNVYKPV